MKKQGATKKQGTTTPEPVDRKFRFLAVCTEHGHPHSQEDAVVFLAKDKALPETLRYYREKCMELGCQDQQLLGITLLIERVLRWQKLHPTQLKVADVDTDTPIGRSIFAPNQE